MMQRLVTRLAPCALILAMAACGGVSDGGTNTAAGPTPVPSTAPSPNPPANCSYEVGNVPSTVAARPAQYAFTITTSPGCPWTARTDATWGDVSPSSGDGSAAPRLVTAENTRNDDTRTLTLTVNNQTFRVLQEAARCTFTLDADTLDARNEGGRMSVRVSSASGCSWSVTSSDSWITIRTPTGTGTDYAYFDVAPNSGDTRQGTVTIAGQRVTVTQARG
jgi:hypothetical protein